MINLCKEKISTGQIILIWYSNNCEYDDCDNENRGGGHDLKWPYSVQPKKLPGILYYQGAHHNLDWKMPTTITKTNWNRRFFNLALYIAEWSKYPGRHVGCVIVDDWKTVVSVGYNGSPRGCDDTDSSKYDLEVKYYYAEHAERNAIYNAARPIVGCTLYTTLFPCADCARGIIQSRIKCVYTPVPNYDDPDFGLHFACSRQMLEETQVIVRYIEK